MSCNDIRFPASAGLGARGAYTIFFDILQFRGTANRLFTVAEITAGLDTTLYETEAAATGGGDPTSVGVPNFRMIDDGSNFLKLAYWDHLTGAGGTWSVTSPPYDFPSAFTTDGYNTDITDDGNHSANVPFNTFSASNIYQVLQDCQIIGFAGQKEVTGIGNAWAYAVWRSVNPGAPAQPPIASFTTLLAVGTLVQSTVGGWDEAPAISPAVPLRKGDWFGVNTSAVNGASTASTASLAATDNNDLIRIHSHGIEFGRAGGIVVPSDFGHSAASTSMGISIEVEAI